MNINTKTSKRSTNKLKSCYLLSEKRKIVKGFSLDIKIYFGNYY